MHGTIYTTYEAIFIQSHELFLKISNYSFWFQYDGEFPPLQGQGKVVNIFLLHILGPVE